MTPVCFCSWGPNDYRCCLKRPQGPYPLINPDRVKIIEPVIVVGPDIEVQVRDDVKKGWFFILDKKQVDGWRVDL
jgi:hypothetical protein